MLYTSHPGSLGRMSGTVLRLPLLSRIVLRTLQRAFDEHLQLAELSVLIASDVVIANDVLAIVNSPAYAPRLPICNIHQALAICGATQLQGLCVAVGVRHAMVDALRRPSMRKMWRHSLACAAIAEQLAATCSLDPGIAFTCGVLHDIGRVALAVPRHEEYVEFLETYAGSPHGILEHEREAFGWDHCELGGQLVRDWELPAEFVPVVAGHHVSRPQENPWSMTDLIRVSCRMADAAGFAAFPACLPTPFEDLLRELPTRARSLFFTDPRTLAFEIKRKLKAMQSL